MPDVIARSAAERALRSGEEREIDNPVVAEPEDTVRY
jgi:hypothetical protein